MPLRYGSALCLIALSFLPYGHLRYASLRHAFCVMLVCVMAICVMLICVMAACVMAICVMPFCVMPLSMVAICRIGLSPFSFGFMHSWFGRFYFKYWSLNFVIDIPSDLGLRQLLSHLSWQSPRNHRSSIIPKKHQPGKRRLILDLSSPDGHRSVNDGIQKDPFSVQYMIADIVRPSCVTAKVWRGECLPHRSCSSLICQQI